MNSFRYGVHYKHLGPSEEDPFATRPLSPDSVRHYLETLRSLLPPHFSNTIEDSSLYITVVTEETQEEIDSASERYSISLNRATAGLSLVIDRLPK